MIPTVKVKSDNEQGFVVINESDVTPEHELYSDDAPAKSSKGDEAKDSSKAKSSKGDA